MVSQGEHARDIFLTKPFSLDCETNADFRAPNLLKRVLSLFRNVRPGSDLGRFQLSPLFNTPKSHLQCFGESVYCINNDMIGNCNKGATAEDRFTAVVAWSISNLRPMIFGMAPFNPILGETHHVSRGTLNVLLEQISHHPPVTALHATDVTSNKLYGVSILVPNSMNHVTGTSIEAEVLGKKELKLLNHGETYEMNAPKLVIKFLPLPWVDWVGEQRVRCQETGLEAEIYYGSSSYFGLRGNSRSVKGKIFNSSSLELLYEIHGQWDRIVKLKDVRSGKETVLYDAKEAISNLKAPVLTDPKGVWPTESAAVWGLLSEAIVNKDWGRAREQKNEVEEKQREVSRERQSRGETWAPRHFIVNYSKQVGWDCSPIHKSVPPAPISVPLS